MPQSVPAMKRKRKTDGPLDQPLSNFPKTAKPFRQSDALEMPAQQWGDEVGGAEEIEAAAQERAGDTVQRREIPCYLGFVDCEMWRDGTV